MVVAQKTTEETDLPDHAQKTDETDMPDHMLLTRNLLRIAIYHISYIRGLFHEKYFSEKSVLSPEMKNEKLMPISHDLGRLMDWTEKGVYDALQKKYLKTLLFCICEKEEGPMIEEYAFSFSYPNTNSEEIAMIISRTGSKKGSTEFKPNSSELTPDQMKRYGCKMIRAIVSLMKTVDPNPKTEERTVLLKMLYYDEVTPKGYEPPCAENKAINIWNKSPLKMEVRNVNSKQLVLALKVKGALVPYDDNNAKRGGYEMRLDNDFNIDGDFFDTQLYRRTVGHVLCTSQKNYKFMLDSGATHHICNDETIMRNLRKVEKKDQLTLYSSGGKELRAEMMGCIDYKNFCLNPVGLIPSMAFNVVSVGQLANQGLMICCGNSQFSIYDMTGGKVVGEGYLDIKLNEYIFRTLKWSPKVEKLFEMPKNDTQEVNDEQAQKDWLIDTGCAQHLVPDVSLLTNVRPEKRPFQTAKGTIWSSHKGRFKLDKLVLNDVFCCGTMVHDNLMSGPALDRAGYRTTFCGKTCTLVHKDGLELRGVGTQDKGNNMYYLTTEEKGKDDREDDKVSDQRDANKGKKRRLE